MAKGRFTEDIIYVQTSLTESNVVFLDKKAKEEGLNRSDIIRRYVMKCIKEDKEQAE